MKKKLLAVDGNSILNRAFYGIRPLTTKDGFPTNALYGLVTMISRQRERVNPDYCVAAFDLKEPTFRHKLYAEYKAGRRPMPEELVAQLPVAKDLLRAFGYTVLEVPGYEADDILGTLASMCEKEDAEAYLLTGDRDALQLISPSVHVLLATNADTLDMDESAFFEKYGVHSSQFVDVKALMGDSSDHIPGVPGIGEKTALKLIADYVTLDGVYTALPDAPLTPSVKKKLEEGKESAYLSQTLSRISRVAPIGVELSEVGTRELQKTTLRSLLLRLEFSSFLKKYGLEKEEIKEEVKEEIKEKITEKIKPCEEAKKPEFLTLSFKNRTFLPENFGEAVAFSYTDDGEFLLSDGQAVYSVKGEESETLFALLAGHTVLCHDAKLLYRCFESKTFRSLHLFDLMLAGYLADSSAGRYEIERLLEEELGIFLSEDVPAVAYYHRLYEVLNEKLEASGQKNLLWEMEMPLALVLADMERAGFRIDRAGIASYGEQLQATASALESQIYFHAGKEFNVNSPKQLGEVLFETLGLPHDKKTKTGYSTNAEILEKLRPYHPIISDILDYRQVVKLKSTYTDGLQKVADETGRVHSTFKQTGTATGRLSSTEPNLQNIPVRTEIGKELRRYFLPENENYVIIDADYSQIELRLLAHISGDENLISAFLGGADVHTSTAATVFGIPPEQVTPELRKRAKAVNFGILYGIGAFSLSEDLGVSRAQAKQYIEQYLAGFPEVDAYLKKTIRKAYEDGFVKTLYGRVRYIPELAGKNKVLQKFGERVAMNSPIQGTAADLIKLAMIHVDQRLKESGINARLILQVHDELLLEAHKDCAAEAAKILKEEMESVANLSVPLLVDLHTGSNWYDAK